MASTVLLNLDEPPTLEEQIRRRDALLRSDPSFKGLRSSNSRQTIAKIRVLLIGEAVSFPMQSSALTLGLRPNKRSRSAVQGCLNHLNQGTHDRYLPEGGMTFRTISWGTDLWVLRVA